MNEFIINQAAHMGLHAGNDATHNALSFHRSMPLYESSPLVALPGIAAKVGVTSLAVKDMTCCFGLPSFKIYGASWAVNRSIASALGSDPSPTLLHLRRRVVETGPFRLVTATDGNHGRAVARMAALLGLDAEVYVPRGTSPARIADIRGEGARVHVVPGSYDDAVARAGRDTSANRLIVSDTSWPGYLDTPRAVIAGYETVFQEIETQYHHQALPMPDLVLLQVGVGALAAAACGHRWTASRPTFVAVEPDDAACLLASLQARGRTSIPGPFRSAMAGLNCDTVSLVAWPILADAIDASLTVGDACARVAVRALAESGIRAGASGAAGLAGLFALMSSVRLSPVRDRFGAGSDSNVLVLCTEGVTDPQEFDGGFEPPRLEHWQGCAGEPGMGTLPPSERALTRRECETESREPRGGETHSSRRARSGIVPGIGANRRDDNTRIDSR